MATWSFRRDLKRKIAWTKEKIRRENIKEQKTGEKSEIKDGLVRRLENYQEYLRRIEE